MHQISLYFKTHVRVYLVFVIFSPVVSEFDVNSEETATENDSEASEAADARVDDGVYRFQLMHFV